jgi:fatty-acyl-CoA synthase
MHDPALGLDPHPLLRTDWLEKWAQYSPDAVALQDNDTGAVHTYADCRTRVLRLAGLLRRNHRVLPGDRVAVLATNDMTTVFLFFALQQLGAILVPVNWRLAPPEIAHVLGDAEPALLVHQTEFAETLERVEPAVLPSRRVLLDALGEAAGDRSLPAQASAGQPPFDSPAMILYTSGTTGRPKGAVITHAMITWNSINTTLRLNVVQSDATLTFAPFFHTGGWNVVTTPFLHRGARVILLHRFDPDRVLELCDRERVTLLFGVPTMMDVMARCASFSRVSLDSVRYAIVGGEPMPRDLIRTWHDKGVPIRQGYGLTEFGPNVFSLNEQDAERKIGSIGFPNFYVDARVVDDAGADVPDDVVGELVLRGPVCTPGYWRDPEATAEAVRDGWFHTGDLVRRDPEGYFYVIDRKKDMYVSGAENVYPAEVERVLLAHPAVREAAVVGVPDPKWGEVGRAFVVLEPDAAASEAEILGFCADRLARYKIPRSVVFLDALPKSDSGKILKRTLKETT